MTYAPDSTIADIKTAIANVATTQISGVGRPYISEPDGPPEDGSVVVGSPQFKLTEDYSGKMQFRLVFPVKYCVRRRGDGEDIVQVESYFMPFILAYNSWANMNITSNVVLEEITGGGVQQYTYAGQVVRTIGFQVSVLAEFNIPLS